MLALTPWCLSAPSCHACCLEFARFFLGGDGADEAEEEGIGACLTVMVAISTVPEMSGLSKQRLGLAVQRLDGWLV